jgi:hypothetical protein
MIESLRRWMCRRVLAPCESGTKSKAYANTQGTSSAAISTITPIAVAKSKNTVEGAPLTRGRGSAR